ncbi:MAG: LemA family protein [Gemmataceae bacterium]|jgi:LemA protein|nr:LemA family protein [Gemmataceae bacterium]MBJ7497880.1 LemA family protein [Gemmataceae bacterium]
MGDLGPVYIGGAVLLVIGFFVLLFFISIYNGLVARRNRFKNGYGQIDVQLKRRYDLIPNLVEAVKGYMAHERATLEAVISARNQAANAGVKAAANPGDPEAMKTLMVAESSLGGTLGRLFALSEAYPDLKANQNMMQLQEELTSTENKVGFSRQAFNDSIMDYNIYRETFPNVIVAGMTGFVTAQQFTLENPTEREAPKLKF